MFKKVQNLLFGMIFQQEKDIEEFKKLCKELDIEVWEHTICAYCGKVIYGCHFWGK